MGGDSMDTHKADYFMILISFYEVLQRLPSLVIPSNLNQ